MYQVTVRREFVAQHFLTVPDPGPEGDLHSHVYRAEVTFEGPELDEYGYLVDIDDVDAALGELLARYRDATLNDLPEFDGLNPSLEHFARIFCDRLLDVSDPDGVERATVTLWEDDEASASFETGR